MMRIRFVFLLFSAIVFAACSANSAPIARVTPLPAVSPSAIITVSATPTSGAMGASRMVGQSTPTPLAANLPSGSAKEIAAATDIALQLTPRSFISFDTFPVVMTFDDFYDGFNLRTGLVLSDKLVSLDGKQIVIEGYMAPPLKPELDYFVLTRIRLAFCPFCSTAADWPDDIALIYLPDATTTATEYPVRVTGRLEVGASVDQETGMVSLVRIYADNLEILD